MRLMRLKSYWRKQKMHKTLCIDCQLKQKAKYSVLCTDCKQKRLLDNYKDIDVTVPENKYFRGDYMTRWTAQRERINADNELLQTIIIYAPHETNEHVRKDNERRKHMRKLIHV